MQRFAMMFLMIVVVGFTTMSSAQDISDAWHVPTNGIYTEDRVDITWDYAGGIPDSVSIDFHDGTTVTLPGATVTHRHVYEIPGQFDITITAWISGIPLVYDDTRFTTVDKRPMPGQNVMFVHHSTGRNLIKECGIRSLIGQYNQIKDTNIRFWDHDYHSGNSYTGIIRPDSTVFSDWSYGVEANIIQPIGYLDIFNGSAFRDSLLSRHDVIIFKNDHRTGDIVTDSQLDQYKVDYLAIRDTLDQYPDKLFIMMSGPPRRPTAITNAESDRAREFYEWLQSPEYMNGHSNIMFFDLFDELAYPDNPADPERNMQRAEYRLPPVSNTDSHPNNFANETIGPVFADFLFRIYTPTTTAVSEAPPLHVTHFSNAPNPFNPRTEVRWVLDRESSVSLRVFDLSGRLVQTMLPPTVLNAGPHTATWDGSGDDMRPRPSGVYLLRLNAGRERHTHRMTLIR